MSFSAETAEIAELSFRFSTISPSGLFLQMEFMTAWSGGLIPYIR